MIAGFLPSTVCLYNQRPYQGVMMDSDFRRFLTLVFWSLPLPDYDWRKASWSRCCRRLRWGSECHSLVVGKKTSLANWYGNGTSWCFNLLILHSSLLCEVTRGYITTLKPYRLPSSKNGEEELLYVARISPIYKPWKGHLEGEQPYLGDNT